MSFLLAVTAFLYVAFLPRFYVGFFNDDALYILASQSLLHGGYKTLYVPGQPPNIHFLPGYPFYLAPFTALIAPHWAWLKLTGVLLMLGVIFLYSKLVRPWVSPLLGWSLTALVAIHPLLVVFSGALMSDPCYLFASLAVFVTFWQYLESGKERLGWLLAFVVAWTSLVRPIGAILIPIIPLGLYWGGRKRTAFYVGGFSLVLWGFYAWRNYSIQHVPTDYFSYFHQSVFASSDSIADAAQRLMRMLKDILVDVFAGWPVQESAVGYIAAALLFCVSSVLCVMGIMSLMKKGKKEQGFCAALVIFLLAHILVHAAWTTATDRYFLQFVPYLWFLLGLGIAAATSHRRSSWLLLLAIPALAYAGKDLKLLRETYSPERPAISLLPQQSLDWIREQTPREALILGKAPMIYLYTGRQGYSDTPATTREEFVQVLDRMGIRYIWWQPRQLLSLPGPLAVNQQRRMDMEQAWTASSPDHFERVYFNPHEGIAIYHVIPPAKAVLK